MRKTVKIIGAGLSGCEAALQLSDSKYDVVIYDSKPRKLLDAYKLSTYAELVCNNAIGVKNPNTPLGMLYEELNYNKSRLIGIAKSCLINDPKYFAVDKEKFSAKVSNELINCGVAIKNEHISELPEADYLIIATGPLTDKKIINNISKNMDYLVFIFPMLVVL